MGWYAEALVGQVSIGGLRHQIFLDNGPFASERIPVIEFQSSPSSLVPWRGGGTLVPGVIGRNSLLCTYFSHVTYGYA